MRNYFSQEELEKQQKVNVLQFCNDDIGNAYDNFDEIPESKFKCDVNGVMLDATGDTINIDDGNQQIEIDNFGKSRHSLHRDKKEITLADEENTYVIDEQGVEITEFDIMLAPKEASDELLEMCSQIGSKVSIDPFHTGDDRPALSCHVESAGGRNRFIVDGEHVGEEKGTFVTLFGSDTLYGRSGDVRTIKDRQGRVTTTKDYQVDDGDLKFDEAVNAEIYKEEFYAD